MHEGTLDVSAHLHRLLLRAELLAVAGIRLRHGAQRRLRHGRRQVNSQLVLYQFIKFGYGALCTGFGRSIRTTTARTSASASGTIQYVSNRWGLQRVGSKICLGITSATGRGQRCAFRTADPPISTFPRISKRVSDTKYNLSICDDSVSNYQ